MANGLGCGGGATANDTGVIDWGSDERAKLLYAAVVSAYATGREVGFGLKDPCNNWGDGVPEIYRVDIEAAQ